MWGNIPYMDLMGIEKIHQTDAFFFFEPPNQQPASNGAPKVWYARAESEGTRSFVTGAARICDPTAGEWWEIKTDVLKEAM